MGLGVAAVQLTSLSLPGMVQRSGTRGSSARALCACDEEAAHLLAMPLMRRVCPHSAQTSRAMAKVRHCGNAKTKFGSFEVEVPSASGQRFSRTKIDK